MWDAPSPLWKLNTMQPLISISYMQTPLVVGGKKKFSLLCRLILHKISLHSSLTRSVLNRTDGWQLLSYLCLYLCWVLFSETTCFPSSLCLQRIRKFETNFNHIFCTRGVLSSLLVKSSARTHTCMRVRVGVFLPTFLGRKAMMSCWLVVWQKCKLFKQERGFGPAHKREDDLKVTSVKCVFQTFYHLFWSFAEKWKRAAWCVLQQWLVIVSVMFR